MSTTDLVASILLVAGALMSLLAGIALVRFPDAMSRIHAATKPQVLGIILLMIGLGLRLQSAAVIGMLVLIVVLQFVTAPVSAHLTVRVAYRQAAGDRGDVRTAREPGPDDTPAEIAGLSDPGTGADHDRGPGNP